MTAVLINGTKTNFAGCDVSIEPRVASAIHLTHAALADGRKDVVGT